MPPTAAPADTLLGVPDDSLAFSFSACVGTADFELDVEDDLGSLAFASGLYADDTADD